MIQESQQMSHQFVQQQPGITLQLAHHAGANGPSTPTTQFITQVATNTLQDHTTIGSQIIQESCQMPHHQYVQQSGVPMMQNLIECETEYKT